MVNYGYGDLSGMFGDRYSTQAALNDAMLKEAMSVGQLSSYGMGQASTYYQAAGGGTPLGSMLTQAHPTMQRQNILAELQKKHPNPDTPEKLTALATDLSANGFGDLAMKVREAANEARASMPKSTYTTVKVGDTDEEGNRITTTWLYKDGKPFKELGSQPTDAPSKETDKTSKQVALKNFMANDDYIGNGGTKTILDFERDYKAATTTPTIPDPKTSKEIALADFLISKAYQQGTKSVTEWEAEWNEATAASKSGGGEADDLALQLLINSPEYKNAGSNAQVEMLMKHKEDWGDDGYRFDYLKNLDDMKKEINPDTGELFTHKEAMEKLDFIKRRQVSEEVEIAAAKSRIESRDVIVKTYNDDASVAWDEIQSLERILKAYKDGAVSGQLKSTMTKLAGIMDSLGFQIDKEKLVSTELLITEFADIALQRMGQLSGSASDNDIIFVKEGAANIKNTKETNMLLVDMALYYAHEKQEAADFLSTYLSSQTETPESWEITAMMEAFKNRGDSSERALAKYGAAWKAAGLDREQAVARHGDNQFKREKRLSDLTISASDSAEAIQQDVNLEVLDQILGE